MAKSRKDNQGRVLRKGERYRWNPDKRLGVSLPKTESGTRVIPMLDQVHDAFERVYEEQLVTGFNQTVIEGMDGFIFKNANGNVLSEQNLNAAIKRISAAYNMDEEVRAAKAKRAGAVTKLFSSLFQTYFLYKILRE